jgi:opacity protein-like surface antigen
MVQLKRCNCFPNKPCSDNAHACSTQALIMRSRTFFGSFEHDLDWYATGVGRLGYAHNQILIYSFAGVAWGKVESVFDLGAGAADHVGWTAGLGLEYALSDRLSLRLEYSHVDLGRETISNSAISRVSI